MLAEPIADCLWRDAEGRRASRRARPLDLEAELGLPGGNIFHRDLSWPFAESDDEVGTGASRPTTHACSSAARAPAAAAA